jgi:predicted Zn-dependent protease
MNARTNTPANAPAPSPTRSFGRKRIALAVALLAVIGAAAYYGVAYFRRDPVHQAVQEANSRRDFDEARRLLEDHLAANPKDQNARLLAAQAARRQGDLRGADWHLQAIDSRAAASAELTLERELLGIQQGDLSRADELLARVARRPDGAPEGLMLEAVIEGNLARLVGLVNQARAGKGEVSEADFARASRAVDLWLESRSGRADQVQGYLWRGLLHALARQSAKSIAAFREALALDADHFRARELLAKALILDEPEEAAKHLEILHQRDRKHDLVTLHLAQVSRTTGNLERAEQLLDGLLAANPDHPLVLVERGRVALDQRKPKQAEHWLRRAVQRAPEDPQANLQLSLCLQQIDQPDEARRFHDKYLQTSKARP